MCVCVCVCVRVYLSTARYSVGEIDGYGEQLADSFLAGRQQTVVAGLVLAYELGRTRRRHCSNAHAPSSKQRRHQTRARGKKGSPYSITERRVPELIPVLGDQPAGDVSHKSGGRLPLLSAMPAVTLAILKRAATNFAAW